MAISMPIEEIKEWWNTAITQDKHVMIGAIDTLLAEVERLNKDLGWANKQVQLKDLELDQAIVSIEISSDIARQEAARECAEIADQYKIIDNDGTEILYGKAIGDDIRITFKLEVRNDC